MYNVVRGPRKFYERIDNNYLYNANETTLESVYDIQIDDEVRCIRSEFDVKCTAYVPRAYTRVTHIQEKPFQERNPNTYIFTFKSEIALDTFNERMREGFGNMFATSRRVFELLDCNEDGIKYLDYNYFSWHLRNYFYKLRDFHECRYSVLYMNEDDEPHFVREYHKLPSFYDVRKCVEITTELPLNDDEGDNKVQLSDETYACSFEQLLTLPESYLYEEVLYKRWMIPLDILCVMTKFKPFCQVLIHN